LPVKTAATCRAIAFLLRCGRPLISAATDGAELMLIAAPLAGLRTTLQHLRDAEVETPFLWVCKGLERGPDCLPHQVVREVLGERLCGVLTGPSFADELARNLPTVVTIASTDANFALRCAEACAGRGCASTPAMT
jgi:glycerol-3-phosphate dehydrogenase (NAD(P)+)